jgi:hypothetical protein
MMNMRPPQQGQGWASAWGASSGSAVCSAVGGAKFKSLRAAAMVSARLLLRKAAFTGRVPCGDTGITSFARQFWCNSFLLIVSQDRANQG